MYYETTTKSINYDGKKVTEQFIMKAVCFTDAETKTIESFGENEKFEITAIKKSRIKEIVGTGEKYFKVTAEYIIIDEEAGREKKIKEPFLFAAKDIDTVQRDVESWLIESVIPTEIKSIVETKIIEVL